MRRFFCYSFVAIRAAVIAYLLCLHPRRLSFSRCCSFMLWQWFCCGCSSYTCASVCMWLDISKIIPSLKIIVFMKGFGMTSRRAAYQVFLFLFHFVHFWVNFPLILSAEFDGAGKERERDGSGIVDSTNRNEANDMWMYAAVGVCACALCVSTGPLKMKTKKKWDSVAKTAATLSFFHLRHVAVDLTHAVCTTNDGQIFRFK